MPDLRPSAQSPRSPSTKLAIAPKTLPVAADGWLLQCPPGLAEVLKKEMVFAGTIKRDQPLFMKKQRNHDLLFANHLKSATESAENMERLRVVETVLRCPVYGRFKISKRQLEIIAGEMKTLGPRRLVVTVAGRVFERHDLSRWLTKEIETRGYDFNSDVEEEVWMFCIDDSWYFGIPVKKARHIEGRALRVSERAGSLPPPVAAAMAFAGMPKETDIVYDPVCGSGTLLAECFHYANGAKLVGIDIDPEAIRVARENLAGIANLELINADARKTGLSKVGVSLVLANLPFGVQYGSKISNPDLYRDLIGEMWRLRETDQEGATDSQRMNSPPWRAIVLTSDIESLASAVRHFPELVSESLFQVKIRGEHAFAYRIKARK